MKECRTADPTSQCEVVSRLHMGRRTDDIYVGVIPRDTVRAFTEVGKLYEHLKGLGFQPKNACEVGSWCGLSAVRFAQIFFAPIVCVDTWLGSEEHWLDQKNPRHDLRFRNGRPNIYEEFLESTHQYRDLITPLPLPSGIAAKVLMKKGFKFDLIYLDGDHSFDGLKADIDAYIPLLADGGYLAGDDYNDPRFEVAKAIDASVICDCDVIDDNFWFAKF